MEPILLSLGPLGGHIRKMERKAFFCIEGFGCGVRTAEGLPGPWMSFLVRMLSYHFCKLSHHKHKGRTPRVQVNRNWDLRLETLGETTQNPEP